MRTLNGGAKTESLFSESIREAVLRNVLPPTAAPRALSVIIIIIIYWNRKRGLAASTAAAHSFTTVEVNKERARKWFCEFTQNCDPGSWQNARVTLLYLLNRLSRYDL